MMTFFLKLIPPRTSFAQDRSAEEAELMRLHVRYWRSHMEAGKVVAFGPVADPAGSYGIAIVEVDDESVARALTERDPVILSGSGFRYETFPMPRGALHPGAQ